MNYNNSFTKICKGGNEMTKKSLMFIFLICFSMLAVSITGCSRNPTTYYQQAKSLRQEISGVVAPEKLESTLRICRIALAKLEFVRNKYPHWESMPTLVDPLMKEYNGLIYSIESNIQVRSGYTYQLQGKYEKALKAYNTVLTEYKDQVDVCVMAQYGIGEVYQRKGEYAEAMRVWQKVVNEYSGHPYIQIIKLEFELIPVESRQELIEKYKDMRPVINRFFLDQISNREFLNYFSKLDKKYKNDAIFFIAG